GTHAGCPHPGHQRSCTRTRRWPAQTRETPRGKHYAPAVHTASRIGMFQDARFTIRQLLKAPGFTLVAIFTLALSICANLVIFSAADAILLHPLPYRHPEQLVLVQ